MTASFDKLKVVVIEDNNHMRMLLLSLLHAFGVKHAVGESNGKSGFILVQAVKPDFVVTDYAMHPVDGVEFVKMVRALHTPLAWLPIIMVTGHSERRYIEQARDAGVTEFLIKPITAHSLYLRIMEVIERPRQFVRAPMFAGPDRRRKNIAQAAKRRITDGHRDVEFR